MLSLGLHSDQKKYFSDSLFCSIGNNLPNKIHSDKILVSSHVKKRNMQFTSGFVNKLRKREIATIQWIMCHYRPYKTGSNADSKLKEAMGKCLGILCSSELDSVSAHAGSPVTSYILISGPPLLFLPPPSTHTFQLQWNATISMFRHFTRSISPWKRGRLTIHWSQVCISGFHSSYIASCFATPLLFCKVDFHLLVSLKSLVGGTRGLPHSAAPLRPAVCPPWCESTAALSSAVRTIWYANCDAHAPR